MRHRVAHRKLGRVTEHRIALLRSQAQALLRHERIRTTVPKAKELRMFVERIITTAKDGLADGGNGKALLVLLWEMNYGHPNLLPAYFTPQKFGADAELRGAGLPMLKSVTLGVYLHPPWMRSAASVFVSPPIETRPEHTEAAP